MPISVPLRRKRKVVLIRSSLQSPNPKPELPTTDPSKSEELRRLSLEEEREAMASSTAEEELLRDEDVPPVPSLFTQPPPIRDALSTESSRLQDETIEECLPWLTEPEFDLNVFGVPQLQRAKHVRYLQHALDDRYPAPFVAMDASRAWIPYWALTGLHALGEDPAEYRDRVIATYTASQNTTGGFGGGPGQLSHLAATYAAVLALATAGGPSALDVIDRRAMWHWLGALKRADGGFSMAAGGEEDIRGTYCALTLASLLNLPVELPRDAPARAAGLDSFVSRLPEWVGACQAFDGGIAAAPGNEAHGAYAFCGLACLAIVGPPAETIAKYLDLPALVACLSSLQHAPEGGFAGRANKLVDGCYSHWVGGCWNLIAAAVGDGAGAEADLWSREGLVRYILSCAQGRKGGLRDKPSKNVDSYHSCYNLAGLNWAQNRYEFELDESRKDIPFTAPYGWSWKGEADVPCEEAERVKPLHPVFVIPIDRAEECRRYFEERAGF